MTDIYYMIQCCNVIKLANFRVTELLESFTPRQTISFLLRLLQVN